MFKRTRYYFVHYWFKVNGVETSYDGNATAYIKCARGHVFTPMDLSLEMSKTFGITSTVEVCVHSITKLDKKEYKFLSKGQAELKEKLKDEKEKTNPEKQLEQILEL